MPASRTPPVRARCWRPPGSGPRRSGTSARPRHASIRSPSTSCRRLARRSRRSKPMSNGKMPDLNQLMKQAQKLQGDVAKVQEEIAKMTCDGAAGGGMVTATVNGQFEVVRIKIDRSVVDPNDIGMLEVLVTAAVNAAAEKVRETTKEKMAQVMGPMAGLPGMPGF